MLLNIVDPATVEKATQTIQTMNWAGLLFLATVMLTAVGTLWLWMKNENKKKAEAIKVELPELPIDEETMEDISKKLTACRNMLEDLKTDLIGIKASEQRIEADITRVGNHFRELADKMTFWANR
jgi:hypothetical protein